MAVYDTSRRIDDSLRRPVNSFSRVVGTIIAWKDARTTRKALSKLSLHELKDIGLEPAEIDAVSRRR